jgi:hypothetical protein
VERWAAGVQTRGLCWLLARPLTDWSPHPNTMCLYSLSWGAANPRWGLLPPMRHAVAAPCSTSAIRRLALVPWVPRTTGMTAASTTPAVSCNEAAETSARRGDVLVSGVLDRSRRCAERVPCGCCMSVVPVSCSSDRGCYTASGGATCHKWSATVHLVASQNATASFCVAWQWRPARCRCSRALCASCSEPNLAAVGRRH